MAKNEKTSDRKKKIAPHAMNTAAQPWRKRQEIPDPQVRSAADQFESARRLLFAQPPGSVPLFPLMNAAAIAIELYLKCLSAEKKYAEAGEGWSKVSSEPIHGHILTQLLGEVGGDVKDELNRAFRAELSALSLRDALQQCEGVFETSRYPFEPKADLSKYPLDILMTCSHFLQQFVAKLQTRETIQWA